MRAALVLLTAALVACSVGPSPDAAQSGPASQATDLRTQLDLALTEHVMITAKVAAAALNGSDEYRAYAVLLTTNEAALTQVVRRASGNSAADAFAEAWRALNADVVDYAIGMATHDTDKAAADATRWTSSTVPTLADELAGISRRRSADLLAALQKEMTALRDTIDGAAAHRYSAMYAGLQSAVTAATTLGDTIAGGIVKRFPDRFPGDQASAESSRRVHLNLLLQERAYLVTMATEAQLNERADESSATLHALSANLDLLGKEVPDTRFKDLLTDELTSVQLYAKSGDADSRQALVALASRLVSMTKAAPGVVANQVDATARVIDDQRAKDAKNVANDDRAAATAMQPIADGL